jgi:pilus assembly protein CpaF
LLTSALRLRPDRIVVGEVRGGEAFYLVQAMNTGHGGSLATCHANTPTDTLRRIESLCLMSGIELPMVAIRAQVASAINFVVCCERLHDGSRKTIALSEVLPLNEKGDYRTQDIFVFTPVTKDEDGHILGYHAPTGIIPTFVAKARAYGFSDLDESFFDPATYGVPPPPTFQVGSSYEVRWAPSLKHRETGHPDPSDYKKHWADFEQRLKDEARHKDAALPAMGTPAVQVQVPANLPLPGAKPAAAVKAPPPAAQAKPAPKPASAEALSDEDKTPPPTRNPFVRPPEQDELSAPEDVPTNAGTPPRDEPKVEVSEDLLAEGGPPRSAPNAPPRRPPPPPAAAAARPTTGASNTLRPAAAPQRKPGSPPPPPRPAVAEDAAGGEGSNNGEKTQIRSPPPERPRR